MLNALLLMFVMFQPPATCLPDHIYVDGNMVGDVTGPGIMGYKYVGESYVSWDCTSGVSNECWLCVQTRTEQLVSGSWVVLDVSNTTTYQGPDCVTSATATMVTTVTGLTYGATYRVTVFFGKMESYYVGEQLFTGCTYNPAVSTETFIVN